MAQPSEKISVVVIVGPTGSGKSALSLELAAGCDGEIVNADSMQVYQGMDIGTAKPSVAERRIVPHHLFDIVTPDLNFSASDFRRAASMAIDDIVARRKRPIIVGGTGLYLKALLHGLVDSPHGDESLRNQLRAEAALHGNQVLLERLSHHDPVTASRLHVNDQVRIIRALEVYLQTGRAISAFRNDHSFSGGKYRCLKIGLQVERAELYRRLDRRVDDMLERGLEKEVRSLLEQGYSPHLKAMRAIGYKEMCAYIAGDLPQIEMERLIKRNTRHYAKRQLTWFLRETDINWLEYPEFFATINNRVIEFFAKGADHA